MRVDVHTLETFDAVAQRGARAASSAFESLTGEPTTIEVGEVNVAPRASMSEHFASRGASVQISIDGAIVGNAYLLLSEEHASRVVAALPAEPSVRDSAILEIGNILISRLVDDVAGELGSAIQISPPAFAPVDAEEDTPERFLFDCQLEAAKLGVRFDLVLALADGHLHRLLDNEERIAATQHQQLGHGPVSVQAIGQFAGHVADGVSQAAADAAMMTGLDLVAEPGDVRFIRLADVRDRITSDRPIGAVYSLSEPPGGFIVFGFDTDSAATIGTAMVPGEQAAGLDGMTRAAILELGNVMTSGLIDGWAELFGGEIDHSPPKELREGTDAILDPFESWIDGDREYGFLIDATVRTPDGELGCDIYTMPDEFAFLQALDTREDEL